MRRWLVAFALMTLAAPLVRADTVRINLFSLFKPQIVEARIVSGDSVALDTNLLAGSRLLAAGCRVRLQLVGEQLNVTVRDAFGSLRQTFTASEARLPAS